jgi:uncharacterized protein (DUF58 family)
VTRRPSPRLRAYLVLGAAGLLAGVAFGRPEPVILVGPLLIAALLALTVAEDPGLAIDISLDSDRLLEGDDVRLDVRLQAERAAHWLEVATVLPPGLVAPDGGVIGLQLRPGVEQVVSMTVSGRRWGIYRVGTVVVRARDRFGFFAFETSVDAELALRVYPRPQALRRAIRPAETQMFSGDEVSRRHGDGIEFADVRPYAPGDQIRRVNWRLSSRRPELHVNELHPERSTDVVILLDTFTDVIDTDEQSSLATAVRGANSIADHYLRRRDRVGLIAFGGSIRWLVPAMGLAQGYRIVDTLLDARTAVTVVWKGVDLIPPRSLPPKALVVALTPLLDDRAVEALLDLRGRGFDLAVIEIGPEGYIAAPTDDVGTTARRLWRLRRELLRDRFRRLGVPVAVWSPADPLEPVLQEVRGFRRYARRASA